MSRWAGWSRIVLSVLLVGVSLTRFGFYGGRWQTRAALRQSRASSGSPRGPDVRSDAVLVMDRNDASVVYSRKADQVAPIASITKLMTSLVVLDGKLPMDEVIEVNNEDRGPHQGQLLAPGRRHQADPRRPHAPRPDVVGEPGRVRAGPQLSGRRAGVREGDECQGRPRSA